MAHEPQKDRTRDRILAELKTRGPRTAQQVASAFDLSTMGAHKALQSLIEEALVSTFDKAEGRGRPKRFFELTEAGHSRFPDNHAHISLELIRDIREEFGDTGLDRVIARREARQVADYADLMGGSLLQKVKSLADLRSGEGYMARVEQDGGDLLLVEDHCPICAVAETCQGFCRSELAVFRQSLGPEVSVERDEHLFDGGRRCTYRIRQTDS